MASFKALGIEKEMNNAFNEFNKTDLQKLIDSHYFENPYVQQKKENEFYCMIKVIDCQHKNWWYKNLIDFEFFCRIRWQDKEKIKIKKFIGIKITQTKEIHFRNFDPKDVVII